ncbi:sensor histidine kinase [Kitasatospora sp. NPDC004240]
MHRVHAWFLRHPTVGDDAWAIGLLVLGGWTIAGLPRPYGPAHLALLGLTAALAGLTVLRRRFPNATVTASLALGAGQLLLGLGAGPVNLGHLLMIRWAASHGSPRISRAALAGALAAGPLAVWRDVLDRGQLFPLSTDERAMVAALYSLPVILCWVWGRWARERRDHLAVLAERAESARTAMVRDAERARIARELHDVITHDLTAMTVQAGGAEHVLRVRPQLAKDAAHGIGSLGRRTLAEIARLERLLTP